jgi:hypothetical protein
MYTCCRSCWITILVLPTHVFGEAILQTSKILKLFIQYPNNTYFSKVLRHIKFIREMLKNQLPLGVKGGIMCWNYG